MTPDVVFRAADFWTAGPLRSFPLCLALIRAHRNAACSAGQLNFFPNVYCSFGGHESAMCTCILVWGRQAPRRPAHDSITCVLLQIRFIAPQLTPRGDALLVWLLSSAWRAARAFNCRRRLQPSQRAAAAFWRTGGGNWRLPQLRERKVFEWGRVVELLRCTGIYLPLYMGG